MGFKAKDIKGLLVLMENEKDGKALAVYGGAEWLRKMADALGDTESEENGNNGGRAGQVF